MLNKGKFEKLNDAIKKYCKTYLNGKITELDESGTRIMINTFLSEVLGYLPLEEIKTEYMIKGTYADYMVQLKSVRHFLVEVKSFSLALSENHLRQAVNYGANEGVEWALLTNGKSFEFYKILFNKPIESRLVIRIDLADSAQIKKAAEVLQFLHKDSVSNKGLDVLWGKSVAFDPKNLAGLLFHDSVTNYLRKTLKAKYKYSFTNEEVEQALNNLICSHMNPADIVFTKVKRVKSGDGEKKKVAGENKPVEIQSGIIVSIEPTN